MSSEESQENNSNENVESSNVNEALMNKLRKMKEDNLINFTDKKDYAEKLKVLANDHKAHYTTVYKAMKAVAKEDGKLVGKQEPKKKQSTKGGQTYNFNAKATPKEQIKLQQKAQELKNKQAEIETQMKLQEQMLSSPVFEMMSQQNLLNLQMVKLMIQGVGGKTGTDEQYSMLAKQISLKELESGWQPSGALANVMIGVSILGVFVLPLIPQLKEMFGNKEKDSDIEQSDEPLDEIDSKPKENLA